VLGGATLPWRGTSEKSMELKGRNVIVTGANTGIGRVTAMELAKQGAHLLLACRSEEKTRPVLDEIAQGGGRAEFLHLDLGDLASVRRCAETFLARREPLASLVNNAGLAGTPGITKDRFELAFGTNHLGHYLFTRLLQQSLEAAGESRVVNVSSIGHYRATGIDWDAVRKPTATTTAFHEYCVSKLANVLFTRELAKRWPPSVHTYALHPGRVASDVWRRVPWGVRHVMKLFMISNEEGAKTTLYCATSDEVGAQTGRYYEECKEKEASQVARDDALAAELWERSAAWTGMAS
jgi:NAD(P)-dependent dehydrogenase (short-subunit alcohol dehydrogenase family)